jgi:glycerol-3-phosphate dehydrogenase (NAD(P)+)
MFMKKALVTIIGGGSFGTALANIAARNGYRVQFWMRNAEQVEDITQNRVNSRYMPNYRLNSRITATSDLASAVTKANVIFIAVPSASFRGVLQQMKPHLNSQQILISTTKGIEAETFKLMSQILQEETGSDLVGVLSGPNLAKEIAKRAITGSVVASQSTVVIETIKQVLTSDSFRVYANSDMYGVELGGALKNIYAIAAGLGAALRMGENTRSMLITRSLAEMSRFAVHMGANPLTFLGLAGVGDLVATCMSPLSRNYRVGFTLGRGLSLEDAIAELGEVAEGVNTLKLVKQKADELNVTMPIVTGLYEIVFNKGVVKEVVKRLMLAEQTTDVEFVLPR